MSHITIPIPQNTIHLYEAESTLAPIYNERPFGHTSYLDGLNKSYQTAIPYQWKALFTDTITIMVHTQDNGGFSGPTLDILDCNMELVTTVVSPHFKGTQLTGFNNYTDPVTGVVTALVTSLWAFSFGNYLTPNSIGVPGDSGIYYLRVNNEDGSGAFYTSLSDPILVSGTNRDSFGNTRLVQAYSDTNNNLVVVDGWAGGYIPTFSIRAEMDKRDMNLSGVYQGFQQQSFEQVITNAESWKTWSLNLGTTDVGVPKTLWEGMAKLWEMDHVFYEGQPMMYDLGDGSDGAKQAWKLSDTKTKDLIHATLPIRYLSESQNALVDTSVGGQTVNWFMAPGAMSGGTWASVYPYAITKTIMIGSATVVLPTSVFYSAADETVLLNYLETTIKGVLYPLTGNFFFNDGQWGYANGPGELLYFANNYELLTKYMTFDISPAGFAYTFAWNVNPLSFASQNIVDWGDNSGWPYVTTEYRMAGAGFRVQSHTYSGVNTSGHTVNWFYDDNLAWIQITSTSVPLIDNALGGNALPANINAFEFDAQNLTGSVDFAPLALSYPTMTELNLPDNGISDFSPDILQQPMPNLKFVNLSANKFSSSIVDRLINDFYNNSGWSGASVSGGIFAISGNTPLAPPTSASATAIATLTAAGMTIIHD